MLPRYHWFLKTFTFIGNEGTRTEVIDHIPLMGTICQALVSSGIYVNLFKVLLWIFIATD